MKLLTEDKCYRWFLFGLILAGGISFLVAFLLVWSGPLRALWPDPGYYPGRDFNPLYDSALALSHGQDPSTLYFYYFPLTILFYLPLSYLSFNQAFIVMTLLNLCMALVMAVVTCKILNFHGAKLHPAMSAIFFLAYIFFCPAAAEITSANVNTLVACFVTLFYYFLFVKQQDTPAAICLVIATLFKVFPAFLVLLPILYGRYKFLWTFVALLAGCAIVSILLLGLPAHLNWVEFLSSGNQGGPALTFGHNITITGVLYKILRLFGIEEAGQNIVFKVIWLLTRMAAVIFIFCLLFHAAKRYGNGLYKDKWVILTYSLFSLLMILLPNTAWVYYATCLALPFILCIFCLDLSTLDRVIIALSLAFFSFNTHIANLAGLIGGAIGKLVYVLHPGSIASLLFIIFVLFYMTKLKRSGDVHETLYCNSRLQ